MTPRALAIRVAAVVLAGCAPEAPTFAASADAPLRIRVDAAPREVRLFEPVIVTWELVAAAGLGDGDQRFEPPSPEGFVAEELSRTRLPRDGDVSIRVVQRLSPTRLGTLEIPGVGVERGDARASTDPLAVEVTSALAAELPEGVTPDLLEEPAAVFAPRSRVAWIVLAAVVVAIAALAWFGRRAGQRRFRSSPDTVELPAHVEALRALARLRNAPRGTDAEIDSFYVGVSAALRRYLERRFGLRAPERTTEEFLPQVASSGLLDTEQQARLRDFLSRCDLVKFARHRPDDAEHVRAFDFAESFVHATRADRADGEEAAP